MNIRHDKIKSDTYGLFGYQADRNQSNKKYNRDVKELQLLRQKELDRADKIINEDRKLLFARHEKETNDLDMKHKQEIENIMMFNA